ncbi:low affinity immunoglobulin gamma Fc region receptor II-like [Pempheris klunzingeri]|uniref:low affinity immunoglobulin gamma Fc region receptor II-like n=1 Tax=Pempheris klunzingeri TaxID=3127111 RepID=UPI00397ECAF1
MEVTVLCVRLLVNVLLLLRARGQNSHYLENADAAFPHIDPNRLQFFEYETITINCGSFHGPTEWRVMNNAPSNAIGWATSTRSLTINPAFVSHSGEYWCGNAEGERRNTLNIAVVTAAGVILETPASPVREQQTVTLRCRRKTPHNDTADFYKDGNSTGIGYTGKMTIHNVSKSDEGLYKCRISAAGESPESLLAVRALTGNVPPAPQNTTSEDDKEISFHPPLLSVLLPTAITILCVPVLLLLVELLWCWKNKGSRGANPPDHLTYATYAVVKKVPGEGNEADAGKATGFTGS